MKAYKTEKVIKIIEALGGKLISSNGHKKYRIGCVAFIIPHHKELSPGTLRDICKAASKLGFDMKAALVV